MINKIQLSKFRNFIAKTVNFDEGITVIVGPNASGKTNILESLFLLSSGKSFHARLEEEMIDYASDIARVKCQIANALSAQAGKLQNTNLEVVLTRGEIEIAKNKFEKTPRKRLLVNGVGKRLLDFAGNFKVVLFGPWDLELVTESPSVRRKFMDTVLSQVDRDYRRASLSYDKGLRQRNKLLWQIRENFSNYSQTTGRARLLFWDRLLIKNGDTISKKRQEFIEFVNQTKDFSGQNFSLEYDKSAISEARLEQYAYEEVAAATTLVGPHRDDIILKIKDQKSKTRLPDEQVKTKERELARYGSRGEQRMGVLWLKLAELAFIEKTTGEKPTLLLDDIFSELDHEHRDIVMKIAKGQQTIISTADPHYVKDFGKIKKIELSGS